MSERHAVLLQILCLANCLSRELGSLNTERSSAGISRVNAQIMSYLSAHEGEAVFQRDIEEAFSIRRSTVSKVVRLMEQKDLIERKPVQHDARLKRLSLTDRGQEIHKVASSEFSAFEARATEALTTEEIRTLSALLKKISGAMHTENIEEKT